MISVAELEPVERPLFGGAGAQAFRPGSGSGYVNSYKMLQKVLNFTHTKFEGEFKKNLFVAFYFKEHFLVLKSMKFFLTMKIFDFFRKSMGKMVGAGAEIFDKLEPELQPEPHKNGPAPQHFS
jgi:hypothetical protein